MNNLINKSILKTFLCSLALIILVGCSANEFAPFADDGGRSQNSIPGSTASCEIPKSKYQINTDIVSLKIKSTNNIIFGFDALKGWFKFFKASFKTKSGELRLEMNINDSINETKMLAHGSGAAEMSKREFSFEFGVDGFGLGFERFSETPLGELTYRGLDNALSDLKDDLLSKTVPWSTVVQAVIEEPDHTEVIISSGIASNLRVGDSLAFYNIEQAWSGEPCNSKFLMSRRTSQEPIAIGTVLYVANHATQVKIQVVGDAADKIAVGAEGVVHLLSEDDQSEDRELRQAITISNIASAELKFENETIDISPFLVKQIRGIAADKGFVIYSE